MMETHVGHLTVVYCNLCLERVFSERGYLCRKCLERRCISETIRPNGVDDLGVFPQLCVDCGHEFLVYASPLRCQDCRQFRSRVPAIPVIRLDQIVGLAGVVVHTEPPPIYDSIPRFELPASPRTYPLDQSGVLAGSPVVDSPVADFFTAGLSTPIYMPMGAPTCPPSPSPFILQ
jgi:hypothetical protein